MTGIINSRIIFLIYFFSGATLSFALPPYNYTFLCFLIFPLIIFLIKKSFFLNHSFFFSGLLFGFGYFLFSLYWISYSLNFDPNLFFLKPFAIICIPLLLSIFYGFGFFCLKKIYSNNFLFIINFSLILSIVEYVRGKIFYPFPWNLIVYTWSDKIYILQLLSLFGSYGLNLLSIFIFSLGSIFILNKDLFRKKIIYYFVSIIFLTLLTYYYANHKFSQNFVKKSNYEIVSIQSDKNISEIYSNPKEYIKHLIKLSDPINRKTHTIFVWPEGVYSISEGNFIRNEFSKSFKKNQFIILGSTTSIDNRIYNTLQVFNFKGEMISIYKKNKLVPFGEFIPFENTLKKFDLKKITQGYSSFSASDERQIVNINNINVLPLICYEIIFSGEINLSKKDYDLIINISEDGWFNKSIGTYQHYIHSQFRAVEEGKQVVRSANQGIGAIIDPNGKVLSKSDGFNENVLISSIFLSPKRTLFGKFGNSIFYLLVLIFLISEMIIYFIKKTKKE